MAQLSQKEGKIFTYWHNLIYCSFEEFLQGRRCKLEAELALTHLPLRSDLVVTLEDPASVADYPIKGVFQLEGSLIPTQFVVLNRMEDVDIMYPFAPLIKGKNRKQALKRLIEEATNNPRNEVLLQIIDYSLKQGAIKKQEWEEVYGMERIPEETQKILESMRQSWIGEELKKEGMAVGKEVERHKVVKTGLANGVATQILTLLTGYTEEEILKIAHT